MSYVLGLPELSNKASDRGTITHKVLEEIALKKIKNIVLTEKQIDNLIVRTYKKFTAGDKMNHHKWVDKDQRDCKNFVWKALKELDVRKQDIVAVEPHFDFTLPYDWAKYSYKLNGKVIKGQLSIKGTVDLITKMSDDTIMISDWKTGRRLDWATGDVKTLAKLQNDPQLLLYYYAVKHMYPDIKYVIVSIIYINDGGTYTICFEDKDIKRMENMLRKRFEIIKNCTKPELYKSWKCDRLCHYGKNTFEKTKYDMFNDGSGFPCTQCEQIHREILRTNIDKTTEKYLYEENAFKNYAAPGEI